MGGAVGAGMGGAMGGMIGSLGGPWNTVLGAGIGGGIGAYSGAEIGDRVEIIFVALIESHKPQENLSVILMITAIVLGMLGDLK
ncbi:hypothetical protein ckin116_13470 [Helicobacter pylori]